MKAKDGFLSLIKGVITGIASLISGISSGALILSLSAYDNFIKGLADIFKKKNKALILVSIPIIIGIIIGLITGVPLINYIYPKFKIQTVMLFIGIITGGYTLIIRKQKLKATKGKTLLFLLVVIAVTICYTIFLQNIESLTEVTIFGSISYGVLGALSLLIPFVSLSNLSLIFNTPSYIIEKIAAMSVFKEVLMILIFVISFLIVLIFGAKIIYRLLKKYKDISFTVISSLIISNIIIILLQVGEFTFNFVNVFTSILTFLWGYILAKNIEKE